MGTGKVTVELVKDREERGRDGMREGNREDL